MLVGLFRDTNDMSERNHRPTINMRSNYVFCCSKTICEMPRHFDGTDDIMSVDLWFFNLATLFAFSPDLDCYFADWLCGPGRNDLLWEVGATRWRAMFGIDVDGGEICGLETKDLEGPRRWRMAPSSWE